MPTDKMIDDYNGLLAGPVIVDMTCFSIATCSNVELFMQPQRLINEPENRLIRRNSKVRAEMWTGSSFRTDSGHELQLLLQTDL
jgi:hypothetical protein